MLDQAWLIPTIPAVSFFAILFFGKRLPRKGSELGILAVGTSFVLACITAVQWINRLDDSTTEKVKPVIHHIEWWQNGSIKFGVGTQVDGLAVMMMFVVTLISLLVHIYSTAYMHDDRRYTHYYAFLSLFTASMLTLVVADNTLQLLVGWELVGLCSFVLIGHWWEEGVNSRAAIKAFLTTRTGDIGLMIGVIITFFAAGTFSIVGINTYALSHGAQHDLLLAGAICLFIGIIGKSGQFPLHTWLPDAMAGPTPVSALIHAATMVVAGVYLGARLYPVFFEGFSIGHGGVNFMAVIGGTTIIIGALLAFVQDDIKKVLAYSTISQLGYMVLALGVGAWTAAVFHLFTHAFFKALLFLGAGSVSHSGSHHSFDMKKDMGGLRKFMPITFWTFMIGTLALAGIFPFAGFWSKDEILVTAGKSGYDGFLVVGIVGAFLDRRVHGPLRVPDLLRRVPRARPPARVRAHDHDPADHPRRVLDRRRLPQRHAVRHREVQGLVRAPHRVPRAGRTRTSTTGWPRCPSAIAVLGLGIGAYFFFRREELTSASRTSRSATVSPTPATRSSSTSTTSTTSTRTSSSTGHAARSPGRPTGSTRTSSTGSSTRWGGVPAKLGRVTYDVRRPTRRRRRDQRHRDRDGHGGRRGPQGPVGPRPAVRADPVRRGHAARARHLHHQHRLAEGRTAMDWFDDWALTLAVFIPLVGMAVVLLLPKAQEQAVKVTALVASLASLGIGIAILADFNYDQAGRLQFQANEPWIDVIHSRYHIGIDGISLPLLILTMIIVPLCVIYSWDHFPEPHNPKAFLALILLLETGMLGTFVAEDLILFFIFFEVVLLPMFFMIGVWGGPNREYASIKFFLFTLFGSALMLVSFLAIFFLSKVQTFDMVTLSHLHGAGIAKSTAILVFAGLFLGFAIKVPMFPFHTWLPDAHTEAPTVGSVLLAAVLLKLGTYGFIRIALPILPQAARVWAPWIGLLAVIGIIYGALCCLAQRDMKRLIAFSSVAHMGFVMLGIATLTSFGINAAIFGMVAHGFITGMLFFLAGSVQERFHTREMSRLGGLLTQAPKLGWILGFCAMASLGLPGSPGSGASSPRSSPPSRPPSSRTGSSGASAGTSGPTASTWCSRRSGRCSPPATCSGCCSGSRSAR